MRAASTRASAPLRLNRARAFLPHTLSVPALSRTSVVRPDIVRTFASLKPIKLPKLNMPSGKRKIEGETVSNGVAEAPAKEKKNRKAKDSEPVEEEQPAKKDKKSKCTDQDEAHENGTESLNGDSTKAKRSKEDNGEKKKDKKEKKEKVDDSEKDKEEKPIDPNNPPGDPSHKLLTQFRLSEQTKATLNSRGIYRLFPIQSATFDFIFEGKDVIGRARTGTGKTLSFALPILEHLLAKKERLAHGRVPRVLVLAPTRELALQTAKEFESLGQHLATLTVYGGTPYPPQETALYRGVDIIVGTPGRVKDLMDRNKLKLVNLEYVVLDEADEMLNIGFADAVEEILSKIPTDKDHQTLLFSATLPTWVGNIAKKYIKPVHETVDLVSKETVKTATTVRHLAIACHWKERPEVLANIVKVYGMKGGRTIIFTNTKAEANEFATMSTISRDCSVLHGDIAQAQREITMAGFREGKFQVLVATDVAARGLDISGVDLIIQTQPPKDSETYIHRAGRTGRAGKVGTVITFFMKNDHGTLAQLERSAGIRFERIGNPQPVDIVHAATEQALVAMREVHRDVFPMFQEAAERILKDKEPVDVVAAALAVITGYTEPFKARSLLGSAEGYTSLLLKSDREIFSPGYVKGALRGFLSEEEIGRVRDIALCTTGGAVVDLPADIAERFLASNPNTRFQQWEMCKTLPPLKPRETSSPAAGRGAWGSGWGKEGGGRGGRFSPGGRGGSGGNGGGSSPRFGGRGGARGGSGGRFGRR